MPAAGPLPDGGKEQGKRQKRQKANKVSRGQAASWCGSIQACQQLQCDRWSAVGLCPALQRCALLVPLRHVYA